jgi:uncharacterized protein YcfL
MKKLFVAFLMLSFLASCQHEDKDLSFESQVAELTQSLLSDGYDPNPSVLLSYDEEQRYTKWKVTYQYRQVRDKCGCVYNI